MVAVLGRCRCGRGCSGCCLARLWGRAALWAAARPIDGVACGPTGVLGAACALQGRVGLLGVPVGGGPPASRPRRELRSEWSISKPARALRTLRHPPHQWGLAAGSARRLVVRPGPAASHGRHSPAPRLEAPLGPATAHRHRSLVLRTLRRPLLQWGLVAGSARRLLVRPGPAASHGRRSLAIGFLRRPKYQ